MCARRLHKSSARSVRRAREEIRQRQTYLYPQATKVTDQIVTSDMSEEEVTRVMRAKMSWWDWFLQDYARYWYVLGAVALDIFLGLGLFDAFHLVDSQGTVIIVILLGVLVGVEIKGYFWIWPKEYPENE